MFISYYYSEVLCISLYSHHSLENCKEFLQALTTQWNRYVCHVFSTIHNNPLSRKSTYIKALLTTLSFTFLRGLLVLCYTFIQILIQLLTLNEQLFKSNPLYPRHYFLSLLLLPTRELHDPLLSCLVVRRGVLFICILNTILVSSIWFSTGTIPAGQFVVNTALVLLGIFHITLSSLLFGSMVIFILPQLFGFFSLYIGDSGYRFYIFKSNGKSS